MSLNANALVTLAQAKIHLDIPSSDATWDSLVEDTINAVSDHIETFTDRKFHSATYTHDFDGTDVSLLTLREYPVTAVSSVKVDRSWQFGAGTVVTEFALYKGVGLKRRGVPGKWPLDSMNVRVTYTAGFAAIPGDLQRACLMLVELLYDMRAQRRTGLTARGKLGDSVAFGEKMPEPIVAMLQPHVRETYVARKIASA